MTMVAKVLTGILALFFLAIWAQIQFAPDAAATQLAVLLGDKDPATMNTFRGDIGGLFLTGGIFCVLGLLGQRHFLVAAAISMGAVIIGRVLGIALDGSSPSAMQGIGIEVIFIAILLFAYRQLGAQSAS